jgi:DNA repair exonuclease SbcCD ATPase subunit
MDDSDDRTASLMTPAKLAEVRKPRAPASPAAWLDQMAADAGHQHLRRLGELRAELLGQLRLRDDASLAAAIDKLAGELPALDFGLLRARGWWARTSGKSRSAGAEFAARFEAIEEAARDLASQIHSLQKGQQAQAGAIDRALVEFAVEYRALDKIIDQGARWLQDMRTQLKERLAQAADAQSRQAVRDDAARCEILVARLKLMRAAATAAQQAHQHAQAAQGRRAALVQMLQQALAADVKAWHLRLSPLAAAAGEDREPAPSLEAPLETHRELQLCVKQAQADCAQLQAQEQSTQQSLSALAAQLGAG